VAEEPPKRRLKVEIVGDRAKLDEAIQKASNAFVGLDKSIVPSVAATLSAAATKSIVGDLGALSETAKAFEKFRPVVAPQIAAELSALVVPTGMPSVAAVMAAGLDKVTFNFAKTLSGSYAGSLDEIAKMLPKFALPQPVVSQRLEAFETRPHLSPADFAPRLQTATEEAVAIAEVESVAVVIDDAVGEIERMSPTQARRLALDLAVLVAALLVLAAYLRQGGEVVEDPKGAGIAIAYAAALVRVYWRVEGKLD
jgi:hypothetical protein